MTINDALHRAAAEILADEAWLKRLQWLAQIETDLK
jgi:hypothetical protein